MTNAEIVGMTMRNMAALAANPYPGRGIVLGTSQDGRHAVQIYWIMGRSDNSRNRVFSIDGTRILGRRGRIVSGVEPDWRIECDETSIRRARQSHQRKMQTARVEAAR